MAKPLFRVIIAGGRYFNNYAMLCLYCDKMLSEKAKTHEIEIVSGCCEGADLLGIRYAQERGYNCLRMPADWMNEGKAAGPKRNKRMAEQSQALIAFWNGESRGTANMIQTARDMGLLVRVKHY